MIKVKRIKDKMSKSVNLGLKFRLINNMIVDKSEAIMKSAVEQGMKEVAIATPVLSGLARGNWQMSLDQKINSSILRQGYATSIQANVPVIKSFDIKNNKSMFLVNNLDYIDGLNKGKSKQAPVAGWIERALHAGIKKGSKNVY